MLESEAEHGFEPAGEEVTPGEADILLRIAALVGEIDLLKRERHAAPVFGARARLAATYFEKRRAGIRPGRDG